jgi:hypothetical protein
MGAAGMVRSTRTQFLVAATSAMRSWPEGVVIRGKNCLWVGLQRYAWYEACIDPTSSFFANVSGKSSFACGRFHSLAALCYIEFAAVVHSMSMRWATKRVCLSRTVHFTGRSFLVNCLSQPIQADNTTTNLATSTISFHAAAR